MDELGLWRSSNCYCWLLPCLGSLLRHESISVCDYMLEKIDAGDTLASLVGDFVQWRVKCTQLLLQMLHNAAKVQGPSLNTRRQSAAKRAWSRPMAGGNSPCSVCTRPRMSWREFEKAENVALHYECEIKQEWLGLQSCFLWRSRLQIQK